MEIKYSNFELDPKIFTKGMIYGLYDKNSNFVYNRIYDLLDAKYNARATVRLFLAHDYFRKHKIVKALMNEFEISKEVQNKRLSQLSSCELIKVLIIKASVTKAKVIVLDHIDTYLNQEDLKRIMLGLKNTMPSIDKTIIFSANKLDNIVSHTSNYVIASEDRIIYNGSSIDSMHEKTEVMKFVDAANEKGANLKYYKDPSDLLKAIYRSVK